MIEEDIVGFGGPAWYEQEIRLPEAPDEPLIMHLRNVAKCADYLLGRPDLAGEVTFQPEVVFEMDDHTQIIGEMFSAHRWHEILVSARKSLGVLLKLNGTNRKRPVSIKMRHWVVYCLVS